MKTGGEFCSEILSASTKDKGTMWAVTEVDRTRTLRCLSCARTPARHRDAEGGHCSHPEPSGDRRTTRP